MTVWRIKLPDARIDPTDKQWIWDERVREAQGLVDRNVLEPDDRLGAIKDAWDEFVGAPLFEMSAKQSKLNRLLMALTEDTAAD